MSKKSPHAAFCEEYDEDAHAILPDTRQVAHIAAKRSKSDLRSAAGPLVEAASDSGYSSRTAATANSTQSAPSGRKSPVPLKVDTSLKNFDLTRVRSKGKDRIRGRSAHPAREENKMQVGAFPPPPPPPPAGYHPPGPQHVQRSPSRTQRRERAHVRHYPGTCWECDQGLYHDPTPRERQVEYHGSYYRSQAPPSVHDYPPSSPQTSRYPPSAVVQVSRSNRPQGRSNRSNSYHSNNRPLSFHGMMPGVGGMVYNPSPVSSRFEHGPPLSSSAYANTPTYAQAPPPSLYPQQPPYYGMPDPGPQHDHQERSVSRPREQPRGRRQSVYEPPPVLDYETSSDEEEEDDEDEEPEQAMPPQPPPQTRQRLPSHSAHDPRDEDYYRMPPPPLKHKSTPQIIQKRPEMPRKSATTASITSERRPSRSLDLTELREALPEYAYRRSSRETVVPERNRSIRNSRRPPTTYHDSSRSARVAVENSRRRRPVVYEDYAARDDIIEDKQRDAEEYQASTASKQVPVPVPLTADALYKAKASHRAESDSGSQKSRSNSSRGSDARTQNGSGVGSRHEEDNNIVMTMNGVTMSFTQESVGGKKISVRAGETGALELNIEGKRPKKYITNGSEYTSASGTRRGEYEDLRRPPRNDRKSDRASRRSSRSTYSGRY